MTAEPMRRVALGSMLVMRPARALYEALRHGDMENFSNFAIKFVVREYRPRQTKRGYYIWAKWKDLSGPLVFTELQRDYPELAKANTAKTRRSCRSWHNVRLTDLETIQAMAQEHNHDGDFRC